MAQVGNLIVVGTYEEFVLGYAIVPDEQNDKKLSLVQTFACHSHRASVRSLAVGGIHLASGSTDETIRLYDMVNQVESGLLNHHNGTVNALAFTEDGTHLISGGDDGTIAVVRTGSWFVEKKWVGSHSGSVTAISAHPSGKLALSIGTDNKIVTWNLVKGRKAYVTNVSSRCRNGWGIGDVQWSPTGSQYAVFMASHAEVYSVATAGVSHTITCSNRVTSITFLEDNIILVGEESGEASIHKLEPPTITGEEGEKEEIARFQAHDRRVKCARYLGRVKDGAHHAVHFVTAGGNGRLCLWQLEDSEVIKICEVGTGCRITSMIVVDLEEELKLKSARESISEKSIPSQTVHRNEGEFLEKSKKGKLNEDVETPPSTKRKNKSSMKIINSNDNHESQKYANTFSVKPRHKLVQKRQGRKSQLRSVNAGHWNVNDM